MESIFHFISNTADGVIAVDRECRIVLWNEAAEMLLGFKAEEVVGKSCFTVIRGRDESGCFVCSENCLALKMALRHERIPTHNLLIWTKAGEEVWVNVTSILVPSNWRDLCVLVHLFRNISFQKELECSLVPLERWDKF